MRTLFWTSLAILIYGFVGYPAFLACADLFRKRKTRDKGIVDESVSVVLSVYNEERVIREKIRNFLALDYPSELLELIVVSDGSTDRTEGIVRSFRQSRIRLVVQKKRGGKTRALDRAASVAKGGILLFTDANSMFDKEAVKMLTRHFHDRQVGLVTGKSIYLDPERRREQIGGLYHKYEEVVKRLESSVGSVVGADGAIYALRKELWLPLKSEYINDLIHPIHAVLQGYRAIFEPDAVCREIVDDTHKDQFNRQTRIMAQSWLIYLSQIGRMIRGGKWLYAWEFTSHKLLRWLTLPVVGLLCLSTIFLAGNSVFYGITLTIQVGFLISAISGRYSNRKLPRFAYLFASVHLAAILGFFRFISGNTYATWNPRNE